VVEVTGITVVLVGLALGSFLNVCIDRLPAGQSLFTPRSQCPACGVLLATRDLVPVFSFLLLRGRCRHCSAPIPPRVLLVEAGTALSLFALWARWSASLVAGLLAIAFCVFIVAGVIILESHIVRRPYHGTEHRE
jgi:leader peptidase (prepilin peptidase)/N-methyltransferase